MLVNLARKVYRPFSSARTFLGLPALVGGGISRLCSRSLHSDPEIWDREDHPKISGEKRELEGISLLEAAQHQELDIEGACEASLACSTCHVILDKETYDSLEPPSEREEDILDMAPQVCETSRLACQVEVNEKLSGGSIRLPMMTRNFYVDGFKPVPH
ncbi:2Fe-2S ferredoxin [Cryptosporidium felis]|nr:2Fe-2S ferredoxin [Cryptosporidium felis]